RYPIIFRAVGLIPWFYFLLVVLIFNLIIQQKLSLPDLQENPGKDSLSKRLFCTTDKRVFQQFARVAVVCVPVNIRPDFIGT
ncbi:MAG: hypothetical protein D6768_08975, partial [Chloroflexi bacterium]